MELLGHKLPPKVEEEEEAEEAEAGPPGVALCLDFQAGRCSRGAACKFSHGAAKEVELDGEAAEREPALSPLPAVLVPCFLGMWGASATHTAVVPEARSLVLWPVRSFAGAEFFAKAKQIATAQARERAGALAQEAGEPEGELAGGGGKYRWDTRAQLLGV